MIIDESRHKNRVKQIYEMVDFYKHRYWDYEESEFKYDDFKKEEYNKLLKELEQYKVDMVYIEARRKEINKLLKNELLNENKRAELINEYNELGFKYFDIDFSKNKVAEFIIKHPFCIQILYKNSLDFLKIEEESKCNIEEIKIKNFNRFIYGIKKIQKLYKIDFDSLMLALDSYIIYTYAIEYNLLSLEKAFSQTSIFWINDLLEEINIDIFLKYYPIKKDYEDYGQKNYWSSKEAIEKIKERHGNIITNKAALELLSEVAFEEPLLFEFGLRQFMITMDYHDISIVDFLKEIEQELQEEKNKKPELKVIK